jgi:oxygen-independent coproporphyrinogen-3 oxidase
MIDHRKLPENEDAFLMSQVARQILLTDGYVPVGTNHYVRPGDSLIAARDTGRLRRNFEGYSDDPAHALIGLGASGISHFPQGYVQNSSATSLYTKAIADGQLAANRGYRLTTADQVVGMMIDMLLCRFEIDFDETRARFPGSRDLIDLASDAIQAVFGPFVDVSDARLVIHEPARPLARLMANVLDRLSRREADI